MSWPINNRADSLQIDYHYIRRMVGRDLGFGYNHSVWNDEQNEVVQEVIDEGMRMYYFPPVLPAPFAVSAMEAHEWTFMRPTWEFDTVGGQRIYPMPENFERPIGSITFRNTNGDYYGPLPFTSAARLRELENRQNYTSPPEIAAIQPGESAGDSPQTLELILHPTPDSQYQLSLQYQAHALRLTPEHPYPLGGQIHGSGVLAACLAVAEMRALGQQGPKYQQFLERLASMVARDRQRGAQILGYNGNGSADIRSRADAREFDAVFYDNVTYGGVKYDGP